MDRRSIGYGEVPYRGQPEPEGPKLPHRGKFTRAEKQTTACIFAVVAFFTLAAAAAMVYFLLMHDSHSALIALIILIFISSLDAFLISVNRLSQRK
jgi:VIT1/CCC1 family predicted Fe2+/Mn2+ transporter